MNVVVRMASENDAAALVELNREWHGDFTADEQQTKLLLKDGSETVMLAMFEDKPIGFICGKTVASICHKSVHGEISELFVSAASRKLGAAKALISSMEEYFKDRGIKVVTLSTSSGNLPAQACYDSCGYSGHQRIEYRKQLGDLTESCHGGQNG